LLLADQDSALGAGLPLGGFDVQTVRLNDLHEVTGEPVAHEFKGTVTTVGVRGDC